MVVLIYGGSGSGKSEYAENLAISLGENRIYLATMQVYDEDGKKRVMRHRAMREGKGFETLEQTRNIGTVDVNINNVVLLECLSNLVANEMFADGKVDGEEEVVGRITGDIKRLISKSANLVIVTNNIFDDVTDYDEYTFRYIRALGRINSLLADMADKVYEVVAGIAVSVK